MDNLAFFREKSVLPAGKGPFKKPLTALGEASNMTGVMNQ